MHSDNHLVSKLRNASLNKEAEIFLEIPSTKSTRTYGQFFSNAEKIAAFLVMLGVQPGDRVAVQAPKTPAMLELYVATVLAGAVFLPLNDAYTDTEISYFLNDATPAIFVCNPVRLETLMPVAIKCGVAQILTLGPGDSGSLVAMRELQQAGFDPVPRGPDDLAAILYTSGTTGRSKGAMLTHRALAANAETLVDYWKFTRDDVLIHALPIFHTHGLFVATNIALMAGASCIFMEKFNPDAVCAAMPDATVLMGVPTFYTRLADRPELAEASKNMRLFISGSAPLRAETHDQWRDITGHAILERYGMTETNMNTSNPYDGDRRAGTVGFPLPGIDVIVADPSGTALPVGEIGILEIRGPNVFAGYWQMPEKTAEELRSNGFFISGDLGKIDADGYVHIVGRSKDMIITGGYNVYPKEVELLIDDIDGVVESAVIGLPHQDFGEAVVAVVVGNADLTQDGILVALAGQLARFKQPKAVILVDALTRNTMGKVQKNTLRAEHAALFDQS